MEAGTIYRVFPGTGEAPTALDYCWRFPGLLEGGPHVEYGQLQQLLSVLPLRLSRCQAMQRMDGSERGLISLSQRQDYLLYKSQSKSNFCLDAQRATERSSLDEIAVSK